MGVASVIDCDAGAHVLVAAAEIGGVNQGIARGIQFRHKRIGASAERALKRPRGRREVDRTGNPRHVSTAVAVHRDAEAVVSEAATKVGGIDQSTACGIQLRHKRGVVSVSGGLQGSNQGEIER